MTFDIPNFIGLIGVGLVLIAYILLQIHKMDPRAIPFSFFNLLGSILIVISLLYYWNLSSMVIEVSWAFISFFGLIKAVQYHFHQKIHLSKKS